jgi:hypothetical protein
MSHSTRHLPIGVMTIGSLGTVALALTISASAPAQSVSIQAPARSEKQSCWHPGLSRNIGIAELSCDVFTSDQGKRPESKDARDPRIQRRPTR